MMENKQQQPAPVADRRSQKKVNRIKTLVIVCAMLAALLIGALVVMNTVIKPMNRYQEGQALLNDGKLDEAVAVFRELGDYKDSREICCDILCYQADALLNDGKIVEGYLILSQIRDYQDCGDLLAYLEQNYPHLTILNAVAGDVVTLGAYEQDNNASNGAEPIEWIVLQNENGTVYLLSKYVLDVQPFNTEDVKECSLDDWLKTTFSETAFSNIDAQILSRVGLLQEGDFETYGLKRNQIIAEYTPYALAQKPYRGSASGYMWWHSEENLFDSLGDISAPVVWETGEHGSHSCDVVKPCGVRPAVWLFADPDELPAEPVYDGSAPAQWPSKETVRKTDAENTCHRCRGTGRVAMHYGNTWNKIEGYGYGDVCGACGGSGRK